MLPGYTRPYYVVDSIIGQSRVHVFTNRGIQSVGKDYIFGIPIIERGLQGLGLQKFSSPELCYRFGDYTIQYQDFKETEELENYWYIDISTKLVRRIKMKYIHQVQNVYYMLHGTELTLKK